MMPAFDPRIGPMNGTAGPDPRGKENDPKALHALCQDFESIFIHYLFREMRKTVPEAGLVDSGVAMDIFEEIMDMEVAREMARKGGLGLGETLYRELTGTKK
ncbi:MAG: rod-binding protein [Deltaproteobacteria bacterium]|nr:rod-binding protein [Deltaproteobacteria bacterium]